MGRNYGTSVAESYLRCLGPYFLQTSAELGDQVLRSAIREVSAPIVIGKVEVVNESVDPEAAEE